MKEAPYTRQLPDRPYNTTRWRKARLHFLRQNPTCVYCEESNRATLATVVDHIEPHRGNYDKFWDQKNWQSLCATHHSGAKQSLEQSGRMRGCDADGNPLDPNHHWQQT